MKAIMMMCVVAMFVACAAPTETTATVEQHLCQPTDPTCITLAQAKQMARDEAAASNPGNVNNVSCSSNNGSDGRSWSCAVTFVWNGLAHVVECEVWEDGEVLCSVD